MSDVSTIRFQSYHWKKDTDAHPYTMTLQFSFAVLLKNVYDIDPNRAAKQVQ